MSTRQSILQHTTKRGDSWESVCISILSFWESDRCFLPFQSDDLHQPRRRISSRRSTIRKHQPTSTHHENNASSMTRPSVLKRLPRFRSLHTASTDPYNAFLSQYPIPLSPSSDSKPDSPIYGKSIALKDNICTNDALPTTCASRTLESTSLIPIPLSQSPL